MPDVFDWLRGTMRTAFKIGKADLDASALTAARTFTLPNEAGELALVDATCEGRLTLVSGDPDPADASAITTIRFTPDVGDKISIYDGSSSLRKHTFSELSLSIGTAVAYQMYDIFIYNSGGTLTLEKEAWANAAVTMTAANPCVVTWTGHGLTTGMSVTFTTTGSLPSLVTSNVPYIVTRIDANTFKLSTNHYTAATGTFISTSGGSQSGTHTGHNPQARQVAVTRQNGAWYKSGSLNKRLLGSFLAESTTTAADTVGFRGLSNLHNRIDKEVKATYSVDSWAYASRTWRITNGDGGFFVVVADCMPRERAIVTYTGLSLAYGLAGVMLNDGTAPVGTFCYAQANGANSKPSEYVGKLRLGINRVMAGESADSGSVTFYGDAGDPATFGYSTIQGKVWC